MIEKFKDRQAVSTREQINKINEIIDLLEKKFPEEFKPELKPCPFCGEVPKSIYNTMCWKICCLNEHCPTKPYTARCDTEAKAIEAWNRRAGNEQAD